MKTFKIDLMESGQLDVNKIESEEGETFDYDVDCMAFRITSSTYVLPWDLCFFSAVRLFVLLRP